MLGDAHGHTTHSGRSRETDYVDGDVHAVGEALIECMLDKVMKGCLRGKIARSGTKAERRSHLQLNGTLQMSLPRILKVGR